MILVADSGSTKTDWRLLNRGQPPIALHSPGINPYFHTAATVAEELRKINLGAISPLSIEEVYFYGAGSSTDFLKNIMLEGFQEVFPAARIEIYHDLLGAARSVLKNEKGIAGILGTGSNSCLYDGKVILEVKGGFGYILGDEGSGMHMGKQLLMDYINNDIPSDLAAKFQEEFSLSKEEIELNVYRKPFPNKFIATFSLFIYNNITSPYCHNLVRNSLGIYLDKYILKYTEYKTLPLSIVGSIAFYYQDILTDLCRERDINLGKIIKSPIEGLVDYHS